jgi:hypothetical protein
VPLGIRSSAANEGPKARRRRSQRLARLVELVTPIDAGRVADAIGRVLRIEELAASLAENGRSLVALHRRRSTEIDRLVDAYGAVLRA